jgi:hypothetical protein
VAESEQQQGTPTTKMRLLKTHGDGREDFNFYCVPRFDMARGTETLPCYKQCSNM